MLTTCKQIPLHFLQTSTALHISDSLQCCQHLDIIVNITRKLATILALKCDEANRHTRNTSTQIKLFIRFQTKSTVLKFRCAGDYHIHIQAYTNQNILPYVMKSGHQTPSSLPLCKVRLLGISLLQYSLSKYR